MHYPKSSYLATSLVKQWYLINNSSLSKLAVSCHFGLIKLAKTPVLKIYMSCLQKAAVFSGSYFVSDDIVFALNIGLYLANLIPGPLVAGQPVSC